MIGGIIEAWAKWRGCSHNVFVIRSDEIVCLKCGRYRTGWRRYLW